MTAEPDPSMVDDENPEISAERMHAMRPASEVLPPELYATLVARYEARRAGPGWEDRAGAMLRKVVGL